MSRLTSTLKQNPAREPPPRPLPHAALTFSHSHAFLSLILSFCTYWAAKLSLSFTAYPGQEGNNASTLCSPEYVLETQSGPLIRHILFSFFFHSPVREKGRGGARSKGKRLSVLPFLFSRRLFFFSCFVFVYMHSHAPHFPVWLYLFYPWLVF